MKSLLAVKKYIKSLLVWTLCLQLLLPTSHAGAMGNLCADLFATKKTNALAQALNRTRQSAKNVATQIKSDWIEKLMNLKRKKQFDPQLFQNEKNRFSKMDRENQVISMLDLQTPEGFMAFLELKSQWEGRDLLDFKQWMSLDPDAFTVFYKRLLKQRVDKGMSLIKLQSFVAEAYWATHSARIPSLLLLRDRNILDKKFQDIARLRLEYEVAAYGPLKALNHLGLIRDSSAKEKLTQVLGQNQWINVLTAVLIKAPVTNLLWNIRGKFNPETLQILSFKFSQNFLEEMVSKGSTNPLLLEKAAKELGVTVKSQVGYKWMEGGLRILGIIGMASILLSMWPTVVEANTFMVRQGEIDVSRPVMTLQKTDFNFFNFQNGKAISLTLPVSFSSQHLTTITIPQEMRHMVLGNPKFLIKPLYGNGNALKKIDQFIQNELKKCGNNCTQNDYMKVYAQDVPLNMEKVLGPGFENLTQLIRASVRVQLSNCGNYCTLEMVETALHETLIDVDRSNEFDRLLLASDLNNMFDMNLPVDYPKVP